MLRDIGLYTALGDTNSYATPHSICKQRTDLSIARPLLNFDSFSAAVHRSRHCTQLASRGAASGRIRMRIAKRAEKQFSLRARIGISS